MTRSASVRTGGSSRNARIRAMPRSTSEWWISHCSVNSAAHATTGVATQLRRFAPCSASPTSHAARSEVAAPPATKLSQSRNMPWAGCSSGMNPTSGSMSAASTASSPPRPGRRPSAPSTTGMASASGVSVSTTFAMSSGRRPANAAARTPPWPRTSGGARCTLMSIPMNVLSTRGSAIASTASGNATPAIAAGRRHAGRAAGFRSAIPHANTAIGSNPIAERCSANASASTMPSPGIPAPVRTTRSAAAPAAAVSAHSSTTALL